MYPWHDTLWQQLNQARQRKHLPHALLFVGAEQCGHEHFLEGFAKALLCLTPAANGQACGHCRSCQVFAAQAHPDYLQIAVADDKQVIGVDQVRVLGRFLELSCSYSPCRVAVFPQADALNSNAANSLLKSLEEPAPYTHLLLFTTQVSQLLPTLRSRCQQFRMPIPPENLALSWLAEQQTIQAPTELLKLAQGRPMAALALDSGEKLAQRALFLQHLDKLRQHEASLTSVAEHWEKQARVELLDWLLTHLHAQLREYYLTPRSGTKVERLWLLYDRLLELKALTTHPLNPRLFIENMLALWVQHAPRLPS